jgi:hypothetical protein
MRCIILGVAWNSAEDNWLVRVDGYVYERRKYMGFTCAA